MPQVRACYLGEMASDPDAAGRVVARIVVDERLPNDVTLATAGQFSAGFQRCLREAVEACPIRTAQRKGVAIVSYPFTFTPR